MVTNYLYIKISKTMEKQTINLNEEQLKQIVAESIVKIMNENSEDETWNQFKTGAKTFFSNKNGRKGGLKDRWNSAVKNYATQGESDNLQTIIQGLSKLLDEKKISPDTTVAQLVGGKYNNNRFGTMTGMAANRQRQINQRM